MVGSRIAHHRPLTMKNKKDIGNLNNKEFGVELDPNNDMKLVNDDNKGQQAYYKGRKMRYLDYYNEICTRGEKNKNGKLSSIGNFSGVSFDKSGKII